MSPIICPICGAKLRRIEYDLGGGRLDCFTCRTSIRVHPTKKGFIIYKYVFPAYTTNGFHIPILTDVIKTGTKLPFLSEINNPVGVLA